MFLENDKELFLIENENFYNEIQYCWESINKLVNKTLIFIKNTPWYRNIEDIYLPDCIEYYEFCKDNSMEKINLCINKWIRKDFKSLLSEIEKFISFINKELLDIEPQSFFEGLNNLSKLKKFCESSNNDVWKDVKNIQEQLQKWRQIYNANKHDYQKMDNGILISKNKLSHISIDPLETMWIVITKIICPLIHVLLITKLKSKF